MEYLTLRPPVEGRNASEILEKVSRGQITSPSALQAGTHSRGKAAKKAPALDAKLIKSLPHVPGGRVPAALSSVAMHALQFDKTMRAIKAGIIYPPNAILRSAG